MDDFKTLLAIKDVMSPRMVVITDNENVHAAAKSMADKNISSLVVQNSEEKILGILTESQIVRKAVADQMDLGTTKVTEVMNPEIVEIDGSESIFTARDMVNNKSVGHLVIVENGKPIGIVSRSDLLKG